MVSRNVYSSIAGHINKYQWPFVSYLLVQVIVVPWLSRVYVICTLSAVLCIPEGEAGWNT